MRSHRTLTHWMRQLLPTASPCARAAARELVLGLLITHTANLTQLARHTDRKGTLKSQRQRLARWLAAPAWEATGLYAHLSRLTRRLLGRGRETVLLLDTTHLVTTWVVLQLSIPWRHRALPVFRLVYPYAGPDRDQPQAVASALAWLKRHLPGPRSRYVLVADRGFPSSEWVRTLQESGWRFVLRVKSNWRMECPEYTGQMRQAPRDETGQAASQWYAAAVLGWRDPRLRGPDPRGRAHVVHYADPACQEPWYLVTTEPTVGAAVQLYRQRMQIEQEFRDLKGLSGLEELHTWLDAHRLASFLAWVAVYEWRLAYFWLFEQLEHQVTDYQLHGKLGWLRLAREWFARQVRTLGRAAPACL